MIEPHHSTNKENFDETLFKRSFQRYYSPLCLFVSNYINDAHVTEDIVEEAFMKLWEKRFDLKSTNAIYSWLCVTARNSALNLIQKEKRMSINTKSDLCHLEILVDEDFVQKIINAEMMVELYRLISELPPQCSKVFTSLYIHGQTLTETAEELNLSINTIKSHRARGLELLRHKLRPILSAILLSL